MHLLNCTKHGHIGVTEWLTANILFLDNKMSNIFFVIEEVHLCGHVFNSVIILSMNISRIHYKNMNMLDKITNVK